MSENSVGAEKPCVIYFQPGQIMFHAHGNLRNSPDVVNILMDWANSIASKRDISLTVNGNTEDYIFGFDPIKNLESPPNSENSKLSPEILRKQAQADSPVADFSVERPTPPRPSYISPKAKVPPPFSLVFATATRVHESQQPVDKSKEKQLAEASKELLDLIIELDEKRGEAPISLEVVSPNWLMSSGPEPGGTGGPGGKPSPVQNNDIDKHHIILKPSQPSTRSRALALEMSQPSAGSKVVVAILDTSYPAAQTGQIYKDWVTEKPTDLEDHPIIKSLFGSGGCLTIHEDRTVNTYLPDTKISGHDYDMTDHGLFVAGLINSIAPGAELHLYQVLNKYGLGDLRSIARALEDVSNRFKGQPLVVNLSLTMNLPLQRKHLQPKDFYGVGNAILRQKPWWLARLVARLFNWVVGKEVLCTCSWFDRQAKPFEWICDLVYSLESRVIAAAGNNAQPGQWWRPTATYPAAFERVFGVGALKQSDPANTSRVRTASYSNLADLPPRKGITTLGGEPGAGNGILGAYIGKFPKDDGSLEDNKNGWAWWCGTSFATPIISGLTAVKLSSLIRNDPSQRYKTENAIQELYDVDSVTTPFWSEDVLGVVQSQ